MGIKNFCKANGIDMLVLFGSAAGGKPESSRDIDLAVRLNEGTKISKLDLIYKLDDFFMGKKIDLVLLSADTDPLLLYEIFMKGACLYESKKDLFEKDKLRAWKLYLDTDKIRYMRKIYLKEFARKVSHVS